MAYLKIYANDTTELGKILAAFRGLAGRASLKATIGESLVDLWQQHLWDKDRTEPNRLGGSRTHYWRDAGDSVTARNTNKGVTVSATQIGIRMKSTGGTIVPKVAKALTIPIHPDAHGKRAREFNNLFIIDKSGSGASATTGILARKVEGKEQAEALYVLRTKVRIPRDPTVFPPARMVTRTATSAAMEFLRTLEGIN